MELIEHPLVRRLDAVDRATLLDQLSVVAFPAGATLIKEADIARRLYLVFSGDAHVHRGPLRVGHVRAGEFVGELGLMTGRPCSASVVVTSDLKAGVLDAAGYQRLAATSPKAALHLIAGLVETVGDRLTEMTENVSVLLRQRSLPRKATLAVRLPGDHVIPVRTGVTLQELLPAEVDGQIVVAGLVDRRAEPLTQAVSSDCKLEPLTTGHWEGVRIYRRSLVLLLLEAALGIEPKVRVQIEHSVGFALRIGVAGPGSADRGWLARELEAAALRIVAEGRPLREEWWTVDEARAHFADVRGVPELLATWRDRAVALVSYGDFHALSMGPLLPNTAMMVGFRIVPVGDGLLLVYGSRGHSAGAPDQPPQPEAHQLGKTPGTVTLARALSLKTGAMMRGHERWLGALGIATVGEFNQRCLRGDVSEVIRVAEGFHEKRVGQIADEISDLAHGVRVVCIAGPSSSGKTTFIKRLKVQLQVNGLHPVELSLDDYYTDRELTPRDEDGALDFEAVEALRLDLLQDHLSRLLFGERVVTARFDFVEGKSHAAGGRALEIGASDILLLEGIHGLNPRLVGSVDEASLFRVFVCPLAQLPFDPATRVHPSDVRLLRRIVRDRFTRGATAADSIARWSSVRRGERRHIFPFQDNANAVFDTSLIYELSVLKVFAERYLLEVPQDRPEYTTAFRLLQLTDRFVAIYREHVPPTSLLREFVGGSAFKY